LVGMQVSAAAMEMSMVVPQETKTRTAIWSCYTIPEHIHKEMSVSTQWGYLYTHVYSSTIHNSQTV
jgi:hypothetical protein